MAFLNGLLGNASSTKIDDSLLEEISLMVFEREEVLGIYRLIRDLIVLTDRRIIVVDKQGVTGKKKEFRSIPFKAIRHFSVETAGYFDLDSEVKIYCSGELTTPTLSINFTSGTDVVEMQKIIAEKICL